MAATAAAAATVHQPNFFELSGGDIKMSYSSTSFGGKPMFHYEDGKVKKDFTGDQVRSDVIHGWRHNRAQEGDPRADDIRPDGHLHGVSSQGNGTLPNRLSQYRASISRTASTRRSSGTEICAGRAAFHSSFEAMDAAARAPSTKSLICTSPRARSSEP